MPMRSFSLAGVIVEIALRSWPVSQAIKSPPLTLSTCPVTQLVCLALKNATALARQYLLLARQKTRISRLGAEFGIPLIANRCVRGTGRNDIESPPYFPTPYATD